MPGLVRPSVRANAQLLPRFMARLAAVALASAVPLAVAPVFAHGSSADSSLSVGPSSDSRISTREMLSRINQPWVQLIDIRAADEYAGRDIRALRGGHIPGAINIPLGEDDASAPLAANALLDARLADLDRRKETIIYGQDAGPATRVAELLRERGFRDVRVFADGWQVWGNTLELPVAAERFADVAALREQLDELQRAVASLSRRAAAPRRMDAPQQVDVLFIRGS